MYTRAYKFLAWIFFIIGAAFVIAAAACFFALRTHGGVQFSAEPESDLQVLWIVFAAVGVSMWIPSAVLACVYTSIRRRQVYLRSNGTRVEAAVDQITPVYAQAYSTSSIPYLITLRWTNSRDGKTYIYRSEPLRFNPERYMMEHGITTLPVYVDRDNPRRYFVDTGELMKDVVVL